MRLGKIRKLYFPFTRASIQSTLMYSVNMIFFSLSELLYCFVMFYVWKAVFAASGGDDFMGFDMQDMFLYLFMTNVTAYITMSQADSAIAEEIKDGSISMRLLKPVNFNLSVLFKDIANPMILFVMVFVPMTVCIEIYRGVTAGMVMFQPLNCLFYLLSGAVAYLISFYMNMSFGFLAFYVTNLWGMGILKKILLKFLSGAVIPLAFMPTVLKNILAFLPFASLSYTPVMIYMGKYSITEMLLNFGLQIFWLLMMFLLCKLIWKSAIKRLCVQGG